MAWKFSRSHQVALHQCPRLCWLRYYDAGHGWDTRRLDLHRATGTLVHSALALILQHVSVYDEAPSDALVDAALVQAVASYRQEAEGRGFDLSQISDSGLEMQRQASLAEGLVRAWMRVRLPSLLADFKVQAVEEEWEVPLDEAKPNDYPIIGKCTECGYEFDWADAQGDMSKCHCGGDIVKQQPQGEIIIMVRLDCLLERRSDGELWPVEFKTTAMMSDDWLESWRYDSQTLQQVWAVEKHTGRPCGGVLVEALYKGVKRKDEATGQTTYYSPLVRGYIKRGVPPFDQDELSWDSAVGRRKGWEAVDVWQWGAVKDWVAAMPDEVVAAQIFSREVFRSGREQEIWVRQTIEEQRRLQNAIQGSEHPIPDVVQGIMDRDFPTRLNSDCYSNKYRQRCAYLDCCYLGCDPAEDERFVVRVPHHSTERDEESS